MSLVTEDRRHPADVKCGQLIRERRKSLHVSQETLADRIGLTFQQVQKYERGTNRVSISKLCEIAAALGCHPSSLIPDAEAPGVVFVDHSRRLHDLAPDITRKLAMLPKRHLISLECIVDAILEASLFTDEEVDAAIHERSADVLNREAA